MQPDPADFPGVFEDLSAVCGGRDLRAVIRNGGSDEEMKKVILEALAEKPDGHVFGGSLEKQKEDKTEKLCMAQIGG